MQNNDYMSYKRNLEFHKKTLTEKVNHVDRMESDRPTKFKRSKPDHLKILTGEEDLF